MRVRLGNGQVIDYAAANYAVRNHEAGFTDLYTKKDGAWVAQLPTHECILEPNPERMGGRVLPDPVTDLERALNVLEHTDERRRVDAWLLQRLKAALKHVDGRSGRWRR